MLEKTFAQKTLEILNNGSLASKATKGSVEYSEFITNPNRASARKVMKIHTAELALIRAELERANSVGQFIGTITGHNHGYEAGRKAGLSDGFSTGFEAGYDVGEKVGERAGFRAGEKAGYFEGSREFFFDGFIAGLKEGSQDAKVLVFLKR